MTIWWIAIGAQLAAGLSMAFLYYAYRSPRFAEYRISDDPHRSIDEKQTWKDASLNAFVSIGLIVLVLALVGDKLVYEGATPWWVMLAEGVVAILIYDFGYYFMHRYPFHEWKLLREQHAVHHAARNPTAIDSLLLHPIETAAGLLLFFGSIAVVGGIHAVTFGVLFFCYTVLNVWNHAGLKFKRGPLRIIGILSEKHDRHHHSMLSGNYASITPLPDMVFGTVE
jgi:sterol desaturase/sphingolipid hydroxylase (fatty acid hydroxylase superfamily)